MKSHVQPVIIIGAARSGTKFLRDILADHPKVVRVPYDINYIWRTGNENLDDDEFEYAKFNVRIKNKIRSLIQKSCGASYPLSDFFVEKTVSNALRIRFVDMVYPDAKYIHIFRNGIGVVESSKRCWREPRSKSQWLKKIMSFPLSNYRYLFWFIKNTFFNSVQIPVWGPRYAGIDGDVNQMSLLQVCARQWLRCVSRSANQLNLIENSRVFSVSYEELVSDRNSVKNICDFLGLSAEFVLDSYDRHLVYDSTPVTERLDVSELRSIKAAIDCELRLDKSIRLNKDYGWER